MGRFLSTHIQFENQSQSIEDLISRVRYYASTNRLYSIEIIAHLQDHAYQSDDDALFSVCRELMIIVQSPSPYTAKQSQQRAGDSNNLPEETDLKAETIYYDNSLDSIFSEKVKVKQVKIALDQLAFKKSSRIHWYVVYRVFQYLHWLIDGCEQKAFLKWVNLQYHCGWCEEQHFTFSRDVNSELRKKDITLWNSISYRNYTKGETYYNFAVLLRNTFEHVIVNGQEQKEPVTNFASGKNRDRNTFMANSTQLINWGK